MTVSAVMNVSDRRCTTCEVCILEEGDTYCDECRRRLNNRYLSMGGKVGISTRGETDEAYENDEKQQRSSQRALLDRGMEGQIQAGAREPEQQRESGGHTKDETAKEKGDREKEGLEALDNWYAHQIQVAVNQTERQLMDQLTSVQLDKLSANLGEMGTVCFADTPILDIVLKQEVSNKTLSYIPIKVSAIKDEDYVMKFLAMVEQKMNLERLPLKKRPAMTVSKTNGDKVEGPNIFGYVDPGAAHTIIRRDVVEQSGITVFHDDRARAMSGFGGKAEKPQGFCFLVNEVTGRDVGGEIRTVRFFTMPAVVEDSVVKFPYLLGGEITNRLRLRYEDEGNMGMMSHMGELMIPRLDGDDVLRRLNTQINSVTLMPQEDELAEVGSKLRAEARTRIHAPRPSLQEVTLVWENDKKKQF